jgi:hypothetical protein
MNPSDLEATNWYVDSVNGSNINTGKKSGQAIQTLTEIASRWGENNTLSPRNGAIRRLFGRTSLADWLLQKVPGWRWLQWLLPSVTVHVMNDALATDVPDFDVVLSIGTQLIFLGDTKQQQQQRAMKRRRVALIAIICAAIVGAIVFAWRLL